MLDRPFVLADDGRLVFDPSAHRYMSCDVLVPSVSQVLRGVGMVDATWYREEHSRRGTDVHAIRASSLRSALDPSTVSGCYAGYVQAIELFDRVHRPEALLIEQAVHIPKHVAGTVDFYGRLNGQPLWVLLDWKTGAFQWWHEAQTAGYMKILRAMGLTVHRRGSVHLDPRGTFDLKWHTSAAGQQDWDSAHYIIERRLTHHGRDERESLCGSRDDVLSSSRDAAGDTVPTFESSDPFPTDPRNPF